MARGSSMAKTLAIRSSRLVMDINLWSGFYSEISVLIQRGDPAPQRLDVLPDLVVLLARFLVHLAHARELQVRLQVPQRAADVVEVVVDESPVPQLAERGLRERDEQLGDHARLRERAHVDVDALQVQQHPDD